jgi:hypothetical protein
MEAPPSEHISKPIPLHFDNSHKDAQFNQLINELKTQRELNLLLMQQISAERQRTQQLEGFLSTVVSQKSQWDPSLETSSVPKNWSFGSMSTLGDSYGLPRADSWGSFASCERMRAYEVLSNAPSVSKKYPAHVRQQKIALFKEKMRRHREKCPVSRVFTGRSESARAKPRVNGKFVKREEQ